MIQVFKCDHCDYFAKNVEEIMMHEVKCRFNPTYKRKTYLDLEIGDSIRSTEIIKPLKKCLSKDKVYKIIGFGFNKKKPTLRENFQIIDNNGNKKRYNLDTFHRRWEIVQTAELLLIEKKLAAT